MASLKRRLDVACPNVRRATAPNQLDGDRGDRAIVHLKCHLCFDRSVGPHGEVIAERLTGDERVMLFTVNVDREFDDVAAAEVLDERGGHGSLRSGVGNRHEGRKACVSHRIALARPTARDQKHPAGDVRDGRTMGIRTERSMALHSVSELSGVLLDAAVAKTLGLEFELEGSKVMARFGDRPAIYSPSTDWAWGGPIVDGERISLAWLGDQIRRRGPPMHCNGAHSSRDTGRCTARRPWRLLCVSSSQAGSAHRSISDLESRHERSDLAGRGL